MKKYILILATILALNVNAQNELTPKQKKLLRI